MGMIIKMSPKINPASNPTERGSIDPTKEAAELNIIPEMEHPAYILEINRVHQALHLSRQS